MDPLPETAGDDDYNLSHNAMRPIDAATRPKIRLMQRISISILLGTRGRRGFLERLLVLL